MVEFSGYSENMWYVYKITNLVNNKIYVGKTDNIKKRWNKHKTAARRQDPKDFAILHKAIRKYGFNNFKIEQLSQHETEQEALDASPNILAKDLAKEYKTSIPTIKRILRAQGARHYRKS